MMINSPNIHMGGTQPIVLQGVVGNDTGLEIYIGEHEYYAELGLGQAGSTDLTCFS